MRVGKVDKRVLGPVLMGFFIMGFCDMVAPITGRIALEFPASRQAAVSFLPTMVFLWFLVLSTPLAALMNRIGRKATALIGYAFTVVGLMVPYVAGEGCALGWYFAGFGLLGVGNTAIQVAINPLLATIVPGERMTSYLTVGQIFRNTSLLLLAPIVTALVALTGSWRLLLPIYAGLTVLGGIWLQATSVAEPPRSDRAAGMADCFRLLGNPTVLLCTLGVACFIAGDVGIGFLSVRLIDNPDSILTTTGFYACRIVGHARRGVGAGAGVGREIPALEHGGGFGALRRAAAGARRNGGLRRRGADGIRHGLRFRDVLRRGDQGRARKGQRSGGTDDSGHLGGSRFGTRLRGHCPLERRCALGHAVRRPVRGLHALGELQTENKAIKTENDDS